MLDHDHGRRNGHPIVQSLQFHVGDDTKPHQRVAYAVTDRKRSHESHATATTSEVHAEVPDGRRCRRERVFTVNTRFAA